MHDTMAIFNIVLLDNIFKLCSNFICFRKTVDENNFIYFTFQEKKRICMTYYFKKEKDLVK